MRYLNKIIFINSAHVPYAEINLDGNVHFIGTQGVGKSTLLRAILFFYNVDKTKLGIRTQDKQKGFDEFYLPHPNSYIIYEVCRENGKFFVVTFLSKARAAFRIVDCPYERQFFVEDDGTVRYEWGKISAAIGAKVFKSNVIRGYEEFRDIIYGNVQSVAKELRRFCILESPKYQNVPRTIQNIFLNQSLESRVIKDTIIDSMDFSNDSIDLNFYREHVKNFQQQYEDIWKWYKTEKNGKVKVKTDADEVIAKYARYEHSRQTIMELCGQLNFASERDRKLIPQIEKTEQERSQEWARQKRLLDEEERKHKDELERLNQEIGALKAFLNKLKEKALHYKEIDIDSIIHRIAQEGELKARLEHLKRQESILTDKNRDITAKYDSLLQAEESQLKELQLQAQQRKLALEREATDAINRLQQERDSKREAADREYQAKSEGIQERLVELQQQKTDLQLKEQKILQTNPFQQEMDERQNKIDRLREREHALSLQLAAHQQEMAQIKSDTQLRRKELEGEYEKDLMKIETEIAQVKEAIAKLDELMSRQKGSLIAWLEENEDGWEDRIGKVLDEEAVLYNTSLNPRKIDSADSVFGIHIDVENIERTVRTPEEIGAQKATLQKQTEALSQQAKKRQQQLEESVSELERKPQARLKELRLKNINIETEIKQTPSLIEAARKELARYEDSLRAWQKKEREGILVAMGKIEKELDDFRREKQLLNAQREKTLDTLRKTFAKQKAEQDLQLKREKEEVDRGMAEKEQAAAIRKKELTAQMDAELKGQGVDVDKLTDIRRQSQAVVDELAFIDNRRADYISWQNDKREYFDQEQDKKEAFRQTKQKRDSLQDKFEARKSKLEAGIKQLSDEIRRLREQLDSLKTALEKVSLFKLASTCPPELSTAAEVETHQSLADILEVLRDTIADRQRRMEDFKQTVTVFKSHFSPQNTFHFRTEFNTDTDYTEFAAELNEFVSNQKIEEYRIRTSAQYADIIRRIAREVSDLNRHSTEIKQTISEINKDFRENNFAGVIKEIELRAVESSDRLMQQLLNIKHFNDENNLNMGELNLFTDEDSREQTNKKAVSLLMTLIELMDLELKRETITLSDTFKLEFKVKENDNDTSWVEKLSNVGSDGTDILVKAMVNIMLINVFKRKISRKFGDFRLHCMMDEIGKLHPNNVEGILKFANVRNIYLINSSPTTYNAGAYRYTYSLSKDERSNTQVRILLTVR